MANTNNTDRITYSIVGRYMTGSAVSAYHLIGSDGKELKATRELTCYLIGRGVVVNCKGQMNGGDIALRGIGISLTELPVKNEKTGEIYKLNTNKSTTDDSVFSQLEISARLYQDGKCVGYVVKNAGGTEKKLDRNTVIQLAATKKINNARINMHNGVPIIRGYGVELAKLPIIQMPSAKEKTVSTIKETVVSKEIPTVSIDWYTVQKVMKTYESRFIKDSNNNASGVYQYPVLDLINAHSARMYIKTEKSGMFITNISKGISTEHSEYGLGFILNGKEDKLKVVCNDINYLAFNLHVLGFIAITAIMKNNKSNIDSIKEIVFENKIDKLLWREYNDIRNDNVPSLTKENVINISSNDMKYFDKAYKLNMGPLSSIGIRKRYPTVSMIANSKAKLVIGTNNGYYEVSRIKYGINNGVGVALELRNIAKNTAHIITSSNLSMDNININNISKICCLAISNIENNLEVTNIIAENEIEESVLSYDVTRS